MFCKHCGAELEPEQETCASCGAPVEEKKPFVMSKGLKITISVILCVALVLGLAYIVFLGAGGTWEDITKFVTGIFTPKENDIFYKASYTADEKKLDKTASQVVATLGEHTLTNSQLQVFYWMQVYDFIEQTSGYTSYYGLDLSKPLNEQTYDSTTGKTWQQAFLENALKAWGKYVQIYDLAKEKEFALPEEYQTMLSELEAKETEKAIEDGFASLDEALQKEFGKGCGFGDYKYYLELYFVSNLYLTHVTDEMEITTEQLETYFEENKSSMEYYGITKEIGNMTDVRHLLISIEEVAGEKKSEYTAAEWESCRQQAQALLDQWLAGDKTEESLIALIKEHSDDTYAETDGGYIGYIYKNGQYVEEFENWCIDPARAEGDYDLVKTSYGYHVMYCLETETAWIRACSDSIRSAELSALWETFTAAAEVNYKQIAIAIVSFQTA